MPQKDPAVHNKIILRNGGTLETEDAVAILSVSSAGVVTINLSSATFANLSLSGNTTIGDAAGDTLTINATLAGKIKLALNGGAASASGILMGVGTTANPATTAVAGAAFIELRTRSSDTGGDNRGLYLRHELTGIAGGGEAVRAFTKISAACSTARGAHLSIDLATAGSLSGFGAAVDAQVMLGGAAYSNTLAAVSMEIYGNTSATVTGKTSMLRGVIQGNATAVANINANAYFLDLSEVVASSVGFIDTDVTALTGYGSLKVKCPDGVTRFIPITTGS